MELEKRIKELHKEVGGEFSPFKLSRYMNINICSEMDLGNILGIYVSGNDEFYINTTANIEKQEDICFQLVTHYASNKNMDLCITPSNFKPMMFRERLMTKAMNFIKNNKIVFYISKISKQKSSLA